jgi:hypothetical protein
MDGIYNQKLYEVVKSLYDEIVSGFVSTDFHSEEFLSSFPYAFMREDTERSTRIADAALLPDFKQEAEKCIEGCYANCSGGDVPFYIADAVEDFLNYTIPRTVALPNSGEIFDRYYRQFDSSIYGKSCLVTVLALVQDVWDHHGGSAVLPFGMRFVYLTRGHGPLNIPYTRERTVPFLEIKKSAHPIGRGRDLSGEYAFQVLQYSTPLPKDRDILKAAYSLAYDVVTKFLLATRIKTYSTAHSDYRGFRMLGHLSTHSMVLMNYADDRIEGGEGRDIEESDGMAIDRLLSKLLPQSLAKFEVINQKIEDAMRRRRTALLNDARAQKLNEIDQLLDYFQVLEALIPTGGSEYISLYAARLLRSPNSAPNQTFELYRFIKDMYTVRNSVMHGRVDDVLSGKLKESRKLDIFRLRHIVYSLACLNIMNGPLRDAATLLALGETFQLEHEYETDQQEWMRRRKSAVLRNANVVFW